MGRQTKLPTFLANVTEVRKLSYKTRILQCDDRPGSTQNLCWAVTESIYTLFDFKNYVAKIMSKSPSRHPFSVQGKLNVKAMVRTAIIFLFNS